MELSGSVQRGLQTLADPTVFDLKTFTVFLEVAFQSLLTAHSDHSILGKIVASANRLCLPQLLPVFSELTATRCDGFAALGKTKIICHRRSLRECFALLCLSGVTRRRFPYFGSASIQ